MMAGAGANASWCLKKVGGSEQKYGLIPLRNGEEISVGRGMDVSIQLLAPHNNLFLSRKHCIFKQTEDGSWTVMDNKSVNGVHINGIKIPTMVPTTLKDGDKLELGQANKGEVNEFIYTVSLMNQSPEEVDKLLKALKRRTEKLKQKLASRTAARVDSENSVKSDSQSLSNSLLGDRKRKERDGEGVLDGACRSVDEPSTSSSGEKRSRMSSDSDHSDLRNTGFRRLMEQVGANMTADELVALKELLTAGNKGENVLERLKSTVKKQEEVEEKNARLEVEYKTRVEEKEEELRRKDQELLEQKKLQEEAVETQKRLLKEKEEALEKMKQEMEEVLETQVKEKENALMEQLRQQREELISERQKVESSLQEEFSKQLAEKDRSLREEQEGMRSRLEEAIREKEAQMLDQLEAEKQAMIEEKGKVEEKLHTALEKDKGLEEEKQRLDEIIQQKEREKADMEDEMEARRLEREQEEKEKIKMAKQAALDDFTNVMENELQCSICSELFIQATTLNCSHSFCAFCIHSWLKRKKECPNCRKPTTSHSRSIVLDNYIDKMIEQLGDDAKQSRKNIVQERKEQDPDFSSRPNAGEFKAPVVISDDDDEDEDEDEDEEESEEEWDYDRFGVFRRRYYDDSEGSENAEEEEDDYY